MQTRARALQEPFAGWKTRFKMVNWSSEGFIEELSFVACFPNSLTHRHTPGIGSGYSQAPRLAGQDLVLHRPLIPCMATYLTEGRDLHTPRLHTLKKYSTISFARFALFPCLFSHSLYKVMI